MNRNYIYGGIGVVVLIILAIIFWPKSEIKTTFNESNVEIEVLDAGTFREYSIAPGARSPKAYSVPLGRKLHWTVSEGSLKIMDYAKDEEINPDTLPDPFFFVNNGSGILKFRISVVRLEKPNRSASKMIAPIETGVEKTIQVAPNGKTAWYLPATLQILEIEGVVIEDEAGNFSPAKKGSLLILTKNWRVRAMNGGGYVSLIGK